MGYAQFIRFSGNSKKGDITPLLKDKGAFRKAIEALIEPFTNEKIDKVVAIEARGFILGGAATYLLKAGFVPVRKGGALPCDVLREEFVDYTGKEKSLEIAKDAIQEGERVLVVDDWFETGAQARATAKMIETLGGVIVGFAVLIDDTTQEAREFLSKYRYHYLVTSHKDTG